MRTWPGLKPTSASPSIRLAHKSGSPRPSGRCGGLFTAAPDLSHRFLAQLTQIDYAREMAFVGIAKNDRRLLGVVRIVADPDYTQAEFAVLVRSDLTAQWQSTMETYVFPFLVAFDRVLRFVSK